MYFRSDNRAPDQLRPVLITPDFITTAEGSVLLEVGNTRVICTASIEETVPPFMRNTGKGWISSEYSMRPRATLTRTPGILKVRILVDGKDRDTLAGHADLSDFYDVTAVNQLAMQLQ